MLNIKVKLKNSIDIYTYPNENPELVNIQFYKINTREKKTIEVNSFFLEIIPLLDGNFYISEVVKSLKYKINEKDLYEIINYLADSGIVVIDKSEEKILDSSSYERYSRQINYFDDLLSEKRGDETQLDLSSKKVMIIGLGAVGGMIAAHLARSGIKSLVLLDYKKLNKGGLARHIYSYKEKNLLKTKSLYDYLKKIDSSLEIELINEKIIPETDLAKIISEDIDMVINTADEPYIGHISVKLGRYLWDKEIALYVAGGFDAHLMSTGELIMKNVTPCIDCCSNTFKKALSNWRPKYFSNNGLESSQKGILPIDNNDDSFLYENSSGGIYSKSLYSASFACMNIIDFLIKNEAQYSKFNARGEYLANQGRMTWFLMEKQKGCEYCG